MAASRTIIVAGAGIGGLTASLALARQGFRVIVMEKAERLEEAGALLSAGRTADAQRSFEKAIAIPLADLAARFGAVRLQAKKLFNHPHTELKQKAGGDLRPLP